MGLCALLYCCLGLLCYLCSLLCTFSLTALSLSAHLLCTAPFTPSHLSHLLHLFCTHTTYHTHTHLYTCLTCIHIPSLSLFFWTGLYTFSCLSLYIYLCEFTTFWFGSSLLSSLSSLPLCLSPLLSLNSLHFSSMHHLSLPAHLLCTCKYTHSHALHAPGWTFLCGLCMSFSVPLTFLFCLPLLLYSPTVSLCYLHTHLLYTI